MSHISNYVADIETRIDLAEVDHFLSRASGSLVFYDPRYLNFLDSILVNAERAFFTVRRSGELVGVLPGYFSQPISSDVGRIYNALPFFGGHGSAIAVGNDGERHAICERLYSALAECFIAENLSAATIVENLLEPITPNQLESLQFSVVDDRIGQLTTLPTGDGEPEEKLFKLFHQKTRNSVRKGLSLELEFEQSDRAVDLAWLQAMHEQSLSRIGGSFKTLSVFEELVKALPPSQNRSRLYVAKLDGKPVAGLLMLIHSNMVEYFTPVSDPEFREQQVLSALIFHVMTELAREGYTLWNWGGTWRQQEGVYRFKSRWGAKSAVYRYVGRLFDSSLLSVPREVLQEKCQYFYAYNFNKLVSDNVQRST